MVKTETQGRRTSKEGRCLPCSCDTVARPGPLFSRKQLFLAPLQRKHMAQSRMRLILATEWNISRQEGH